MSAPISDGYPRAAPTKAVTKNVWGDESLTSSMALNSTGLSDMLGGMDSFTVPASNDAAFATAL